MALTLTYPEGGALVIGGTGRVGTGIVRQFALAGVPVLFTYRGSSGRDGEARSSSLEQELRDAGHQVRRLRLNLADAASVESAINQAVRLWGCLHTVACASGPVTPWRRIADFQRAEIENFLADDMFGYFRLYSAAVRQMRVSSGGVILGTTTMANMRVIDYDGISPLSKAGVDAMTRQIAAEEAKHNIRCNAVAIGWVDDHSLDAVAATLPDKVLHGPETETEMFGAVVAQIVGLSRLGRNARPEEVGNLFAFLASDQASYITGQTIIFDGGMTL